MDMTKLVKGVQSGKRAEGVSLFQIFSVEYFLLPRDARMHPGWKMVKLFFLPGVGGLGFTAVLKEF